MEKYDVFLSYSHADIAIAESLSKRIRRFRIPSRIGYSKKKLEVFRDTERLSASADLTGELTTHLDSSRHLVLIVSEASKRSGYVDKEIAAYLSTRDVKAIIFVLVNGELSANLPPALQGKVVEPLFIDLRNANKKKFNHESLRLIAALLNADFTLLSLEDLKYRRRRRQITGAIITLALIIAASIYLIVSTDTYHWKPVDQPKLNEEIMPVHEIVINRKNPSIVLFKGINAKYGTNPRPQGESVRTVDNSSIPVSSDKDLKSWVQQRAISPVISMDFTITNHTGKGEINIYAALSGKDSVYYLRNLHYKGKNKNGDVKEINTALIFDPHNQDPSDLYPAMKILMDEKIVDLYGSEIETVIYNHIDGKKWKQSFALRSNDEGYDEWVEIWGPSNIVFSNDTSSNVIVNGDTLRYLENDPDVWDNILKDPAWVPFTATDKKNIGFFSNDFDIDSIKTKIPKWLKETASLSDPAPIDKIMDCAKRASFADVNAIVKKTGKQYGIILEVRGSMDNETREEKTPCYFCKVNNSKPWIELKLPGLKNSGIIDLIPLDSTGKNFMILTDNKGYFRTFDGGKSWKEFNHGEISFQNGSKVKTLVLSPSAIYAFVDRNTSVNEGANTLFVLEQRNWFQRWRIGLAQLIGY